MLNNDFHSGFVSIIGRPNVGKSTLLNTLAGVKVAIVSNKPQTTRNNIRAVLTRDDFQAVFIDTPGINKPARKLDAYMQKSADTARSGMDIVLFLAQAQQKSVQKDILILEKLKDTPSPVFLIINKIDRVSANELLPVIDSYKNLFNFAEIIPISALTGENTDELISVIKKYLPKGIKYFPDDYLTDMPERQLAAEIIREKALLLLQEEIPHGIAVEILSMKERGGKSPITEIEANIYCEKTSHKGMIIGKAGAMLKQIGTLSRRDIERLLGVKVNLQTWVKVKDNWRDNDYLLRAFGYDAKGL